MPYQNERAPRLGHVGVVRNQAVKNSLQRWEITSGKPTSKDDIAGLCRSLEDLVEAGKPEDIDYSITVDGSDTEVEATREHPTVKVGYLRVAGSMTRLDEFRQLAADSFIDPRRLREAHSEYSFDVALPGSQLAIPGLTGAQTWRKEVNDFLLRSKFDSDTEMTLADGLLALHGTRGAPAKEITLRVCPNPDCGLKYRQGEESALVVTKDLGKCPQCDEVIFLADVLRTHEEYNPEASNFTPLGRVMIASERLMTVCYLNYFADAEAHEVLRRTLFVTDGPLQVSGPIAPLKRRFEAHLSDLTLWCEEQGLVAPLMVGVEKGGNFVEHALQIQGLVPPGSVMMLTNAYINRIQGQPESHKYGVDEFYGRRFIYRTLVGDPLVITVLPKPGLSPYSASEDSERWESYPTLRLICEVLDSLRTRLYENAVSPLALAHSAAALPLGVGKSVLTMMAQENIPGLEQDFQSAKRPSDFKPH